MATVTKYRTFFNTDHFYILSEITEILNLDS